MACGIVYTRVRVYEVAGAASIRGPVFALADLNNSLGGTEFLDYFASLFAERVFVFSLWNENC